MIDLMAEGYRLWGMASESGDPLPAEVAEIAETAQPWGLPLADRLRTTCGNPQPATNPQSIRSESAACKPHGYGNSAESAESAAPDHEIERIITVLTEEVGRDLGLELIDLMRRAMRPLDRDTRATLAAEVDNCFEYSSSVSEARAQAALAIRGKVGDPEPRTVGDWLEWVKQRCELLPEDGSYITSIIKLLPPARMATACRWYVQAWARAAEAEPELHKKDNAGRRAANMTLMGRKA